MKLQRLEFREDGIFSKLLDDNGNIVAYTLEHSFDMNPKIYDGEFTCIRGTHRLHNMIPFQTFEITGVVGHTNLLFHQGNYNVDSDGCCLLGAEIVDSDKGRMVTNSVTTFAKFMEMMDGIDSFQLTVSSTP